jgi:hypothetical protein
MLLHEMGSITEPHYVPAKYKGRTGSIFVQIRVQPDAAR